MFFIKYWFFCFLGNDDLSNKYEQYLNESYEVLTKKCIAVKISNDSVAFQQFKQICIFYMVFLTM